MGSHTGVADIGSLSGYLFIIQGLMGAAAAGLLIYIVFEISGRQDERYFNFSSRLDDTPRS